MIKRFLSLSLTLALSLSALAQDRAEEIAQQLKGLSGKFLDKVVLFVNYGEGPFDWLAVTPDGNFVAKLEGMNRDGTFRYTVLGDPADYGLKLNVSLNGVEITTLDGSSSQGCNGCNNFTESSSNLTDSSIYADPDEIQNVNLAITTFVVNTSVRNATPYNSQRWFSQRGEIPRKLYTEECEWGGSVAVESSEERLEITYNQCNTGKEILDGSISLEKKGPYTVEGSYSNYSYQTFQYRLVLPQATVQYIVNDYGDVIRYTINAPNGVMDYLEGDYSVRLKDFIFILNRLQREQYIEVRSDYRADCQSEWSHLKTVKPVVFSITHLCPIGGVLLVTRGESEAEVRFGSDESIEIVDRESGSQIEYYPDCRALPSTPGVCD
ncbi:MAG: hypothetical protein GXO19_04750 [Epsilonproteobacteria bacterium]|nr:hypothetical protein [Campylobacterota bacterium]NPA57028.1 hypothetical protein [Campylobacterota bacterium]